MTKNINIDTFDSLAIITQTINSLDWFLYDNVLRHERVNSIYSILWMCAYAWIFTELIIVIEIVHVSFSKVYWTIMQVAEPFSEVIFWF